MAISSYDSVYSMKTERINVGVGSTVATLVSPEPGQLNIVLKYFSGGTLEIIGCSLGVTLTAAQLASANQTGYLMGTSEILTIDGPARFYLSSTAATTIVMVLRGRSQDVTYPGN